MTRRAQTEMLGLVIVVALVVIGFVLYTSIASRERDTDLIGTGARVQGTSSFVVALAEITVPRCNGVAFSRVARACAEHEPFCISGDPCREAQDVLEAVAAVTLDLEGVRYNVSVTGTPVALVSGCNQSMDRVAATPVPIILSGGGTASLIYTLCSDR